MPHLGRHLQTVPEVEKSLSMVPKLCSVGENLQQSHTMPEGTWPSQNSRDELVQAHYSCFIVLSMHYTRARSVQFPTSAVSVAHVDCARKNTTSGGFSVLLFCCTLLFHLLLRCARRGCDEVAVLFRGARVKVTRCQHTRPAALIAGGANARGFSAAAPAMKQGPR